MLVTTESYDRRSSKVHPSVAIVSALYSLRVIEQERGDL